MLDVTLVDDLPGGTSRLIADATASAACFVNGRAIVGDGARTGDLPGTVAPLRPRHPDRRPVAGRSASSRTMARLDAASDLAHGVAVAGRT